MHYNLGNNNYEKKLSNTCFYEKWAIPQPLEMRHLMNEHKMNEHRDIIMNEHRDIS